MQESKKLMTCSLALAATTLLFVVLSIVLCSLLHPCPPNYNVDPTCPLHDVPVESSSAVCVSYLNNTSQELSRLENKTTSKVLVVSKATTTTYYFYYRLANNFFVSFFLSSPTSPKIFPFYFSRSRPSFKFIFKTEGFNYPSPSLLILSRRGNKKPQSEKQQWLWSPKKHNKKHVHHIWYSFRNTNIPSAPTTITKMDLKIIFSPFP